MQIWNVIMWCIAVAETAPIFIRFKLVFIFIFYNAYIHGTFMQNEIKKYWSIVTSLRFHIYRNCLSTMDVVAVRATILNRNCLHFPQQNIGCKIRYSYKLKRK